MDETSRSGRPTQEKIHKSPRVTTLFSALAGPILIICLVLIFGPCLMNKGLDFVRARVNAVQLMVLQRQYQPIVRIENEDDHHSLYADTAI